MHSMEILINRPFDKTPCKNRIVRLRRGSTIALVCTRFFKTREKLLCVDYSMGGVKSWLPKGKGVCGSEGKYPACVLLLVSSS